MKTFQLAIALALAGSAAASSTARPFGTYSFYDPGTGNVPNAITVNFHPATVDVHIQGCGGGAGGLCFNKFNFACNDNDFRIAGDKLSVDDLQYVGCLKANLDRNGFQGYEYEMSYNAAEDNIAVLAVGPNAAWPNRTIVLSRTA